MMSMSKPNGCEATLTSYVWQIKGANKPDKGLFCNQEELQKLRSVKKNVPFDISRGQL